MANNAYWMKVFYWLILRGIGGRMVIIVKNGISELDSNSGWGLCSLCLNGFEERHETTTLHFSYK